MGVAGRAAHDLDVSLIDLAADRSDGAGFVDVDETYEAWLWELVSVGALAVALGVRPSTLRHWEAEKLLSPRRTGAWNEMLNDRERSIQARSRALLDATDPLARCVTPEPPSAPTHIR